MPPEKREILNVERRRFFLTERRDNINRRRAITIREYRSFMRALASDVCKKVGMKKLRKHREMNRCMLTKCEGMRDKTRVIIPSGKSILITQERERLKEAGCKYQGEGNKVSKIQMHVRGINTLGKEQELANQWEKGKINVAMLSDMQKNTGDMERGRPWGKYVCFYNTGTNPKTRDAQEKIRENRAAKFRKKL